MCDGQRLARAHVCGSGVGRRSAGIPNGAGATLASWCQLDFPQSPAAHGLRIGLAPRSPHPSKWPKGQDRGIISSPIPSARRLLPCRKASSQDRPTDNRRPATALGKHPRCFSTPFQLYRREAKTISPSAAPPEKAACKPAMSSSRLWATKLSELHQGRPDRDADWIPGIRCPSRQARAARPPRICPEQTHGSKHSLSSDLSRPMSLHPPPSRNTTGMLRARALHSEIPQQETPCESTGRTKQGSEGCKGQRLRQLSLVLCRNAIT